MPAGVERRSDIGPERHPHSDGPDARLGAFAQRIGVEAIAAVARLTRQRVASLVSSHDRDTDVTTEVFTVEPSFKRGAPPLADRRAG